MLQKVDVLIEHRLDEVHGVGAKHGNQSQKTKWKKAKEDVKDMN